MTDGTMGGGSRRSFNFSRAIYWVRGHLTVSGVILAVLIVAGWAVFRPGSGGASVYRTATVEHGPITRQVTATGTLNAVVSVDIGAQVTGQVAKLQADFNSEVTAGQILAIIDPKPYQAKLDAAQALLALAKANALQRQADILSAVARRDNAKLDLERKKSLTPRGFETGANLDLSQSTFRISEAAVASAEASLAAAEAQVQQNQAQLAQAQLDLDHTSIRSSVDGTVVNRAVDIGQMVTAGFQTPVMFTVAKDLHKMQLQVSVDEADVGQLRLGQQAAFSVDSFPGEQFKGKVDQIRLNPKTVQNVVTYVVIVTADNPDLRLFPGMTANVTISVAHRDDATKVPNAALRFRPALPSREIADLRRAMQADDARPLAPGQQRGVVWVLSGGKPKPASVILGLADPAATEIVSGPIKPGDSVVIGSTVPAPVGGGFGPPGGGGPGGGSGGGPGGGLGR